MEKREKFSPSRAGASVNETAIFLLSMGKRKNFTIRRAGASVNETAISLSVWEREKFSPSRAGASANEKNLTPKDFRLHPHNKKLMKSRTMHN